MATTRISGCPLLFLLLLLLLFVTVFRSPPFAVAGNLLKAGDATSRNLLITATQRKLDRAAQNCTEASTKLQCLMNSKCRWCQSEVLDDTCFTKSEAFRLPSQVFSCE
ncbi:hypothetical protein DCAR_0104234 [Daucus carota subsp. sativus]|uniref:Uncharacterized protein n=1 Tax=Daucus carota subsp. sativus TaxID=79200 RepID=A0A166INI7_DAUCS|nr:hypothetical protein DCAR_0104234 [Daucus carota subsp. sativus]